MKRPFTIASVALASLLAAGHSAALSPIMTNQGPNWTQSTRDQFYTQDQGSQIMPLNWFRALKQVNGQAFALNSLDRYGYLPNPNSPDQLPVGFSTNKDSSGVTHVGLTCSGCHVRQITVVGIPYRIDGGPAITDFQSFLNDLDKSVTRLLNTSEVFDQFAIDVLGGANTAASRATLRAAVEAWFLPFHTIVSKSVPATPHWGPSRVDAVSMIFNRLAGLDIGTTAPYIIPENIALADAPARYPFLWNSHLQDFTQWPGFSMNGSMVLALSRNLGEVYGVFAKLHPVKAPASASGYDFLQVNSANFAGLNAQETQVSKMGPPKWPWPLDYAKVAIGQAVFYKKDASHGNQSCNDCHGVKQGAVRGTNTNTWLTPVMDVGTDSREANLLMRQVKTGILEGAKLHATDTPLQAVDSVAKMLHLVVEGTITQFFTPAAAVASADDAQTKINAELGKTNDGRPVGSLDQLAGTGKVSAQATPSFAYESRVMQGIWAAAPYLHNGSVPTLAELLKPAASRVSQFAVGPAYDILAVGLSPIQTKFNFTYQTTDCTQRNSGNSRCGHEFGTGFTLVEKLALLEYLKQL